MSPISTTGDRIDRWDNGRPARGYHARLIERLKLERSSRFLCSEVFITFIRKQHDDGADLILAPYKGAIPFWLRALSRLPLIACPGAIRASCFIL